MAEPFFLTTPYPEQTANNLPLAEKEHSLEAASGDKDDRKGLGGIGGLLDPINKLIKNLTIEEIILIGVLIMLLFEGNNDILLILAIGYILLDIF